MSIRQESKTFHLAPPGSDGDKQWLHDLWLTEWGGDIMISRGHVHHLKDLSAIIAWQDDTRVGAATFHVQGRHCELLSINAIVERSGVGTALLAAAENHARESGCHRTWLITTNDNLNAMAFYQKRGYRMVAVYPNAVDIARRLKPDIPRIGHHQIPLHDEMELEKRLF